MKTTVWPCTFASDRDSDHRVCFPPPGESDELEGRGLAVATDSAPSPAPIATDAVDDVVTHEQPMPVLLPEFARKQFLQPNARQLAEAEMIADFYAGVPYQIGLKRHQEYLREKAARRFR